MVAVVPLDACFRCFPRPLFSRLEQAGWERFQQPRCFGFMATQAACWLPWPLTGLTSNCRSRQRSSRWCARSGVSLGRCVEALPVLGHPGSGPSRKLLAKGRDGLLLGPLHRHGADLEPLGLAGEFNGPAQGLASSQRENGGSIHPGVPARLPRHQGKHPRSHPSPAGSAPPTGHQRWGRAEWWCSWPTSGVPSKLRVVNDHSCGAGSSVFRKLGGTLETLPTPGPVAGQLHHR